MLVHVRVIDPDRDWESADFFKLGDFHSTTLDVIQNTSNLTKLFIAPAIMQDRNNAIDDIPWGKGEGLLSYHILNTHTDFKVLK